jgi:hypothetical protein
MSRKLTENSAGRLAHGLLQPDMTSPQAGGSEGRMSADWRRWRRDVTDRAAQQPTAETSLGTAILALIAGALLTVTTGLAAMKELEQFGPKVGSIIVLRPNLSPAERWSVSATIADPTRPGVADVGSRRCLLSPSVMAARGGSIVVEARQLTRPPTYRVHWAGGHTDHGDSDCGARADLLLERAELMRLANVAGGFSTGMRLIGP